MESCLKIACQRLFPADGTEFMAKEDKVLVTKNENSPSGCHGNVQKNSGRKRDKLWNERKPVQTVCYLYLR